MCIDLLRAIIVRQVLVANGDLAIQVPQLQVATHQHAAQSPQRRVFHVGAIVQGEPDGHAQLGRQVTQFAGVAAVGPGNHPRRTANALQDDVATALQVPANAAPIGGLVLVLARGLQPRRVVAAGSMLPWGLPGIPRCRS